MNYGPATTGVDIELETSDPLITVHDGSASFGDIALGATASNAADPYSVEAAAGMPSAHLVDFTLTATYPGGQSVSHFQLCVGQFHYLVWDPTYDLSSGPVIANTLKGLGHLGHATPALPVDHVERYSTLFVSVGIYDNNHIIGFNSPEANAILAFLDAGGNVYLEGGDVWYYDPTAGGHNFCPYFGILALADGSSDMTQVIGLEGTFAEGMSFPYSGENNWMDHIWPTGSGVLLFRNASPDYGCAVFNDTGTYRTIGASFEFAGLVDGASPSTKAELLGAIMDFFMPVDPQAVGDEWAGAGICRLSRNTPNPFATATSFRLVLERPADVNVGLYDAAGRCVKLLVSGMQEAGTHEVRLNGRDMDAGIYFIRSRVEGATIARKCVVVR
jgi:hypothetical protein